MSTNVQLLPSAEIETILCYVQPSLSLYNEDCLETLKRIETGSVDLMITDPPYGVLNACKWDKSINVSQMWLEWERILKPNGAWIFTATQPFASELITAKLEFFKYEWIWRKNKFGNFLNAKIQPLRNHENVLVFYKNQPVFNPPKRKVKHSQTGGKNNHNTKCFNITGQASETYNSNIKAGDFGNPTSVIDIDFESEAFASNAGFQNRHPTQKPLELFRFLIKTYSNEGDTVFDGYSGSGTTAHACIKEGRKFIGSELNKEYYEMSVKRLSNAISQPELFIGA